MVPKELGSICFLSTFIPTSLLVASKWYCSSCPENIGKANEKTTEIINDKTSQC